MRVRQREQRTVGNVCSDDAKYGVRGTAMQRG